VCAHSTNRPVGVLLFSTLLVVGLLAWTPLVETIDISFLDNQILNSELQKIFEIEKFVGKTAYVADHIDLYAQHYINVEKFISKANFVVIQVAEHSQQLADPEKFIGKSKFVGQHIAIASYDLVDPKQPALLVLLFPLASFVIIRAENHNIRFYRIQKILSFIFIMILLSSSVIAPFSYSFTLWDNGFAQEADRR